MRVLNFGSCNIDKRYYVDHISGSGETISSYDLTLFAGGKGLNQSIALSRAGAKVYHAGCIGADGLFLKELLCENNVDVKHLSEVEGVTGHAIIQLDKTGENSILLFGGANMEIDCDFINSVLTDFAEGDFIILQNEISNIDYIVDKAYERGMQIVFNPSPFNDNIEKIDFNKISYLILNETEMECLTGEKDENVALTLTRKKYPDLHILLTLGRRGSIYSYQADYCFVPAYAVQTVDTTGAGDTYTGFFVAQIINGSKPETAMNIAAVASALAVSKHGASPSIPTLDMVENAKKELRPSNEGKKDDKLVRFKKLLSENYASLSLGDVAEALNYSESYVGKWIYEKTGKTFLGNIHLQRCTAAAGLLKNTDMSIGEIVNAVGYNNAGYFRKIFNELYGMNPLEMRNKERKTGGKR